ncbi:uncharacterized protein SPSK_10462 [Sporothrix schenckii 1099-18]|uniref:Uncharacterized protein n=1 Tax=Sporothrix schenckii 1099-18 TaxID=1397361 RepID=A0A0F2MD34_SPOSC|nr:uncharacterized protein SPSK_10462 [Sporothrix schenckii 1099-18]KJR86765.1 hypothetical protein SPSK_10462 [Sporothrix schenckii 1099-18]
MASDPPSLKRLQQPQRNGAGARQDAATHLEVVIVPDQELWRARRSHDKHRQTTSVPDLLQRETPQATVYEYSGTHGRESISIWHALEGAGETLAAALAALDYSSGIRPLGFVASGFGGCVVKKAVHKLGASNLAFIVFLGAPHVTNSRDLWPKLDGLLRAYGYNKSYLKKTEDFIPCVAGLCTNFEKMHIEEGILSVCETLPTSVGFWKKSLVSNMSVTVDRNEGFKNVDGDLPIPTKYV